MIDQITVLILCGGLATRLQPITKTIPKSLVMINNKPMLQYQLDMLQEQGIRHVVLCIGYLGEMKIIPVLLGVLLGFIPFLLYYYMIYVNYVTQDTSGYLLFWYFFFFWSLYGIAALLPYYTKNVFYNILDLFAKNFFGLFLSYLIFSGNY